MSKDNMIRIAVIIALAVIVLGVVYYSLSQDKGDDTSGSTNADTAQPAGDVELKPDDYGIIENDDGSFIYYNNLYSYQLEFPQGWQYEDMGSADLVDFFDPVSQEQEVVTELLMGMKMEIFALESYAGNTLDDIRSEIGEFGEIMDEGSTYVDGEPALKVKMTDLGYSIITYVLKDNVEYHISGYVGDMSEKEKYEALYSRIVDSWEFY